MIKGDDDRGQRHLLMECSQLKDGYIFPVGEANMDNVAG